MRCGSDMMVTGQVPFEVDDAVGDGKKQTAKSFFGHPAAILRHRGCGSRRSAPIKTLSVLRLSPDCHQGFSSRTLRPCTAEILQKDDPCTLYM